MVGASACRFTRCCYQAIVSLMNALSPIWIWNTLCIYTVRDILMVWYLIGSFVSSKLICSLSHSFLLIGLVVFGKAIFVINDCYVMFERTVCECDLSVISCWLFNLAKLVLRSFSTETSDTALIVDFFFICILQETYFMCQKCFKEDWLLNDFTKIMLMTFQEWSKVYLKRKIFPI